MQHWKSAKNPIFFFVTFCSCSKYKAPHWGHYYRNPSNYTNRYERNKDRQKEKQRWPRIIDLSAVGSVNTSRGRIGHLCSHVPIRTFTVFNIHDDVVSTDYWYEVFESARCFSKTVSTALPDPTLDTLQTCTQHIKHFYGCSFSSDTSFYGCWIRIKPMLSCFKQIMQRPVFF